VKRPAFALIGLLALSSPAIPQEGATPADDPAAAIGRPKGAPLSGAELDARTEDVSALLRCPVCQGLSVADSPSTMARNMKAEVREKLATGYDREQILAHFERSYGEFVRLEPPMRGVNWLVWFAPLAVLGAGAAVIALALKRPRPATAEGPQPGLPASPSSDLPSRDTLPADAHLAAAMRRVRNLAYGWPDGVPPKSGSLS
jgi:cytochrome c-type biogenesis protein CcmH